MSLWRLPIEYRHQLDTLAAALAAARRDGFGEAQPHPAVVVSAVDLEWAVHRQDEVGDWAAHAALKRGWQPHDERHFGGSALTTRLQERRHAGSSYHAPLAIFPLCAEDVVDLLMGFFDYAVVLRVDALVPAFASRRIDVEFATGREAERVFLRARRGPDEVTVPAHLRDQMLRELMAVETLVDIVDALLIATRLGGRAQPKRIVVCDESASWPSPPVYLAA